MNLVETSALFKKIIFTVVGILMVYIAILIIKTPTKAVINIITGKNKILPTACFGKLEAPEFQYKKITNSDPQYILNTKNGKLPVDLPDKLPVFRLGQPIFSYEAGKNAQQTGKTLGYYDDTFTAQTNELMYKWVDPKFNSALDINTRTREIKLDLNLYGKGDYYQSNKLTSESATEQAKGMLITIGRFSDLYYTGDVKTYLGKFVGSEIHQVDYDYETQIVRVDFSRRFRNYPILGPDPYKGLLHVWVGAPKDPEYKSLIFPRMEVYQWEIVDKDKDQNCTYPLIPVSVAWADVAKNKGVIAGIVSKNANPFEPYQPIRIDKILVNNIYIAYYDTPKLQKHMQPVYVFEGNYTTVGGSAGQISIYYPAISGDYILPVENGTPAPVSPR